MGTAKFICCVPAFQSTNIFQKYSNNTALKIIDHLDEFEFRQNPVKILHFTILE